MATWRQNKDFREASLLDDLLDDLLDKAIEWIKSNMSPEDVFDDEQLEEWANTNAFILDKNQDE